MSFKLDLIIFLSYLLFIMYDKYFKKYLFIQIRSYQYLTSFFLYYFFCIPLVYVKQQQC